MAYNLGYVATGYNLGYTGAYNLTPEITAADAATEAQSATVTITGYTADPTELRLGGTVVAHTFNAGVLTYTAPLLPNNAALAVDVDVDGVTISTTIVYTNTYIYTHTPAVLDDNSIIPQSSFGTTQLVELKVITDANASVLTVDWAGYDADNFASAAADFVTAVSEVAASTDVTMGYHITETGASGTFTRTLSVADAPADTTPDAFTLTDETDVALSTPVESNAITVAGVDAATDIPVTITGGEYAVSTDGGSTFGAFTSAATNVQLNAQIKVRVTTSASNSTPTSATLTVGGVSDTFTATTEAAAGQVPQGTITFGAATIDGNSISQPFSYDLSDQTGFESRIDGGAVQSEISPVTASSLAFEQTILIEVRAINANGVGSWFSVSRTTTAEPTSDAPVITLIGGNRTITLGATWEDPGFEVSDDIDDLTVDDVSIIGTVDTDTVGDYTLTYSVTDSNSNTGTAIRIVSVVDASVAFAVTNTSRKFSVPAVETGRELGKPRIKRPNDVLDYDVDFAGWLFSGDTIYSADVTADTGLTVDSFDIGGTVVRAWLSGGTTGQSYDVDVDLTTTGGRTKRVTFNIRIRDF